MECGFWREEGGGEIDISAVAKKIRSVPRETGAQVWFKRGWLTIDDEASCVARQDGAPRYFISHPT